MSDRTRIQRALERGDVRAHDWASLPTPDGGSKPILRVGARIEELRRGGLDITTVEKRPSALYRLNTTSPAQGTRVATADAGRPSAETFDNPQSKGGEATDGIPTTPASPLIPNVAQAGIAASLHAQFDDDGDDDLGWIADRYDDNRRAA